MAEEFVEDIIAENTPDDGGAKPEGDQNAQVTDDQVIDNNDQNLDNDDQKIDNTDQNIDNDDNLPAEETIESIATKLGWNPDHKGDEFVDATTFILKSREIQDTMKEHNRDLRNQLSNVQGSIEALKDHNERVYKADIRRMQNELDDLKKQKREAVELADVQKVDEIDKKIEDLQEDMKEPAPKETPASDNPVFDDWVKDNQWYLIDDDMAAYAETVAQEYKGAPLDRIYQMVRRKVEEVFPEKFEKPKDDPPKDLDKPDNLKDLSKKEDTEKPIGPKSPVEQARKTPSNTFTKADLTDDQRAIMNQFVKSGVMTEEQYIQDVAKMQEA